MTRWNNATQLLSNAEKVVILTHLSPDGDAIGSLLGLGHAVINMGKKVVMVVDEGVPLTLRFLPGADLVKKFADRVKGDLVIALDCGDEARMGEIFSLIREEVKRSGHAGMLPAGAVLTGGAARLAGVDVLARDTLEMPVRTGSPQGVGGLMDQIGNPAFSTPIGLLLWGAHHLGEEPIGYGVSNGTNPLSRVGEWVRNLFPG